MIYLSNLWNVYLYTFHTFKVNHENSSLESLFPPYFCIMSALSETPFERVPLLKLLGAWFFFFFRGESHRRITATGKFTQPRLISANCEWARVVPQHSHLSPGCLSEAGWPTTIQRLVMRESIMWPTLDKGCWIPSLIGWPRVFFTMWPVARRSNHEFMAAVRKARSVGHAKRILTSYT